MALEHRESPLIDRTLSTKAAVNVSRMSITWALLNLLGLMIVLLDLKYGSVFGDTRLTVPIVWYSECFLVFVFSINMAIDLVKYLWPKFSYNMIELTQRERMLLGVKQSEPGFRTVSRHQLPVTPGGSSNVFSQSSIFSSPLGKQSPGQSSPSSGGTYSPGSPGSGSTYTPGSPVSPFSLSRGSPQMSVGGSPYLAPGTPGASFHSASGHMTSPVTLHTPPGSHGHSFIGGSANSSFTRGQNVSPFSGGASPFLDSSGLRSRLPRTPRSSPMATEGDISDMSSLSNFLQEQSEKEYKSQLGNMDMSASGGPSFWSFNRSASEFTPILRKYQYQLACRSPESLKSSNDDDPYDITSGPGDEMWMHLGVYREDLDRWIENLRKWLCQTIFMRLVEQIDEINRDLARIGCEDMQIGEVSIATLKQLAFTKSQYVPMLNNMIPFLDISTNQNYVLQRIRELGKGGSLSDFHWQGGAEYKGKPWGEHLPTDAVIVMHGLCSYLDQRLPPHPKYPDGKTFTSQHFVKTPDKPGCKKESLMIYQSRVNPPHYKVILGEDTWDLPKGRNNMFQAILLFLHHTKHKEKGMLGRVNLGLSGINLLWVIDSLRTHGTVDPTGSQSTSPYSDTASPQRIPATAPIAQKRTAAFSSPSKRTIQ